MSLVTITSDHGIELAEVASFPTIPMAIGGVLFILVAFLLVNKYESGFPGLILAAGFFLIAFAFILPTGKKDDAIYATVDNLETFYGVDFTDLPYIIVNPKNPSEIHRSFIKDAVKNDGTVYPKVLVTQKDNRVSLSIPVDAEGTEYVDLQEVDNIKKS